MNDDNESINDNTVAFAHTDAADHVIKRALGEAFESLDARKDGAVCVWTRGLQQGQLIAMLQATGARVWPSPPEIHQLFPAGFVEGYRAAEKEIALAAELGRPVHVAPQAGSRPDYIAGWQRRLKEQQETEQS